MAINTNAYMSMRSGGGSDCVQETSWRYGIQSVTLAIAT